MHSSLNNLTVLNSTPEGEALLARSQPLQEAMRLFGSAEEPHKARVPHSRLIGAGLYAFTFAIDGVAVKIASPTSSLKSFILKEPQPPEELSDQFLTLSALKQHLRGNKENITVPKQFFVAHTTHGAYIHAQEFMEGWISYEARTTEIYGSPGEINASARKEIAWLANSLRPRLFRALGGFALRENINDLGLHKESGVHGGNLLVPRAAPFDTDVPLCIIDQPKVNMKVDD